jgi:pepF/M3 family oligoendopeptidase
VERTVPVAEAENIAAFHPDRVLRRRAHEGIVLAFQRSALPLAAALNSVKGQRIALSRRRGWGSPLDQALFEDRIDRGVLDAMLESVRESYPEFRRFLGAKARLMGLPVLAWYDFSAPVGASGRTWEYEEATAYIIEQFARYSDRLGELARRAFEENWIDAEPREGKTGGALCMWLRAGESRILMNYSPSFLQVSTLAHELGHAYHNHNLANLSPLRRSTPMTLAETASTFCEMLVRNAGMEGADDQEHLQVLDAFLSSATSLIAHTSAAFLAERRLFERREERELSVEEFNTLVSTSLSEIFGDSIDADTVNPYWEWAYLPHMYLADFYNFQYAFGLLFGLGLYSRYQENPAEFVRGYDALLADTGLSDVASLASRFEIDIGQPDFWRSSLAIVRADIDRFEGLVSRRSMEASSSTTAAAHE